MTLGELEAEVMATLWSADQPMSVREVREALGPQRDLAYTTVMTVLVRLAKKGCVERRLGNRAWLYSPALRRVDLAISQIETLTSDLAPDECQATLDHFVTTCSGASPAS
ncbi:MAG: BlaI/MecI/CopY family transcriptional regulator [Propionibacteriaceae bacterium]|jgi:predicted transcriptional regulator|nr:BlaI/MecI/CopY family transcriptional regulator [Propionibacteriaceae bacterium]